MGGDKLRRMSGESSAVTEGSGDYIYVRLAGARFDAPGMPAEAVQELKVLSGALFQLARIEWLNAHPDRTRVPGGFAELFDLRLVSIGEGSAKPQLVLQRPKGWTKKDDPEEIFPAIQRAPVALVRALEGVRDDRQVPTALAKESVALISRIGRTLDDAEQIELATSDPAKVPDAPSVILDLQVRNTLRAIEDSLKDRSEPEPVQIEGVITEFDGTAQTFRLRMPSQPAQVHGRIAAGEGSVSRSVKEALAEDGVTAPDVRLTGWSVVGDTGIVRELHDVVAVEVVRTPIEKKMHARLAQLAELEDGWWEPTSLRPSDGIVVAMAEAIPALSLLARVPDMVARTDGTLALESEIDDRHLVAVIEAEGQQIYLCADDGIADDPEEFEGPYSVDHLRDFFETGSVS